MSLLNNDNIKIMVCMFDIISNIEYMILCITGDTAAYVSVRGLRSVVGVTLKYIQLI